MGAGHIYDENGEAAYTEYYSTVTIDTGGVGYDVWVTLCQNGIDDDGDDRTDPYLGQDGFYDEIYTWYDYYDTTTEFLTPGSSSVYLQGPKFTGDRGLPGGRYWRVALRMGMPEGMWFNINVTGNLLRDDDSLMNMDDDGLRAGVAKKTPTDMSDYGDNHLGLLGFRGYADESTYFGVYGAVNDPRSYLRAYNPVCYSPLQISLREIFYDTFASATNSVNATNAPQFATWSNLWSDAIIHDRYGGNDRAAAGHASQKRLVPGWRADGASYYVLPSPEGPLGHDTYYGASEAIEHATPALMTGESANPAGSRTFGVAYYKVFGQDRSRTEWASLISRSRLSSLSRDDILRGKIWFTEKHGNYRQDGINPSIGAYAVPSSRRQEGEWRHLSILKRVNLNILGAQKTDWATPLDSTHTYMNYPPGGISAVKERWTAKQHYEQDRCYYMVKGALLWSGNSETEAAKSACSLVATLTDMIDRDQDETVYSAPPGEPNVKGYGVERFPVINEVGLEIQGGGEDAAITHFRVELYNPTENIPWLRDSMEAIDLTHYKIRIHCATKTREYTLTDKDSMGHSTNTFDDVTGKCTVVPMSGLNGTDSGRYLHVNLDDEVKDDYTPDDMAKGCLIELIKQDPNNSSRWVVVDRASRWTGDTRTDVNLASLVWQTTGSYIQSGTWYGVYRRIDPMNAKTYAKQINQQGSIVHGDRATVGLAKAATFGFKNLYFGNNFTDDTTYNFDAKWCRILKIPDTDLPSIGWIGEAPARHSYMDPDQTLTITEIHDEPQEYLSQWQNVTFENAANQIETKCKVDLFKPFGDFRNLHILDIFTCWDPSNDCVDNDGDGQTDEDDEVVVFGRLDTNAVHPHMMHQIIGIRPSNWPPTHKGRSSEYGRASVHMSPNYCRGRSDSDKLPDPTKQIWAGSHGKPGAHETIGDLLRMDKLSLHPGWGLSWGTGMRVPTSQEYAADPTSWATWDPDRRMGFSTGDDDGDGMFNEHDEADVFFTAYSNLFTTRNKVFTVEILTELTERPYHPGLPMPQHLAYKIRGDDVHSRKHLLAVLDRTSAFQVQGDGICDFNGPVRILALRWAQVNK